MGCGRLGHGMEDVMVSQGAIGGKNLLARAARSYGLKYAIQPFP
jgi:hypothetical protein